MSESTRQRVVVLVFVALVVVAGFIYFVPRKGSKLAPDNSTYYTGPMRNKSNPNIFTTDDGKVVPTPPGAGAPPDPSAMPGSGGRIQ